MAICPRDVIKMSFRHGIVWFTYPSIHFIFLYEKSANITFFVFHFTNIVHFKKWKKTEKGKLLEPASSESGPRLGQSRIGTMCGTGIEIEPCWNMRHEDSIATYPLVNYIEVNGTCIQVFDHDHCNVLLGTLSSSMMYWNKSVHGYIDAGLCLPCLMQEN